MAQNDTIMRIRLPADLKSWLSDEAERNLRSLNAEVVFMLRDRMTRTDLQPTT
jgi:hypothetical protein